MAATTTTTTRSTTTSSSSTTTPTTISHFDISQLPSLIKDGMTIKEEATQRRKTCRFIEEAGRVMKLPRLVIATAMVMFHRFYAKHTFKEHDRFEVAVACIVLAAKTEESPKKLNTVISECHKLKMLGIKAGRISSTAGNDMQSPVPPTTTTTQQSSSKNKTSSSSSSISEELDVKSDEFMKLKDRILLLERVTLHTIGFELSIDHPYKFLVDIIRVLVSKQLVEFITNPASSTKPNDTNTTTSSTTVTPEMNKQLLNTLVQMSMNFANDSMHTSLCLQFDPKQIAKACIYLGCNFANIRPVVVTKKQDDDQTKKKKDWIDILDITTENDIHALASISLQILELIAERKGADNEIIQKIRQYLDKIVVVMKTGDSITNTTKTTTTAAAVSADGGDNNKETTESTMKKSSRDDNQIMGTNTPDDPDPKRQRTN